MATRLGHSHVARGVARCSRRQFLPTEWDIDDEVIPIDKGCVMVWHDAVHLSLGRHEIVWFRDLTTLRLETKEEAHTPLTTLVSIDISFLPLLTSLWVNHRE